MKILVRRTLLFASLVVVYAFLVFHEWSKNRDDLPLDGIGIKPEHQLNAVAVAMASVTMFAIGAIERLRKSK